jgi:hypothetical protein
MFNSNTTNEYNYYDKQGRYIGTKRIVHLSNDAIHSMWLTKYDNGTEDSFHAADELFFYHLHNLANTKNGDTVYLVGGEKSADALAIRGSISVSAPDGADPQKFPSEVVPYFTMLNVIIIQNNDDVGKLFALAEASLIHPVAASVKIIDLSEIWESMPEHANISDYLQLYGDAGFEQVKLLIEKTVCWTPPKTNVQSGNKSLAIRSVKDLMTQHFVPTEFLVNGILPLGLTLLASPPKFGKSWFSLLLCLAVAKGTPFLGLGTTKSDVLYLDLEDGDADLQERIKKLNMGEEAPAGLLYSTEAPTLADGLLDTLNQTLSSNPSIKLIVIDTLGVVLGAQNSDSNQFAQEYALYGSLKKVANAHSIALLVIHHLRKTGDDNNPFNRIYGGVATQAALDTMMVLEKDTHASDSAHLHVSGRRCPQQDFVLSFDADTCIWSMVGNSAEADEKFHRNQYERSEAVVTIKEAVASGNGSWSGSMSDLSRMAETIPCIGHGLGYPRSLSNEVNHFKNDLCRYDGITITIAKNGTGGRKYTFSKATH